MVLDAAVRFAFASGIIDDGAIDAEKLEHILRVQISGIQRAIYCEPVATHRALPPKKRPSEEDSTGTDVFIKLPGEAHNDYET